MERLGTAFRELPPYSRDAEPHSRAKACLKCHTNNANQMGQIEPQACFPVRTQWKQAITTIEGDDRIRPSGAVRLNSKAIASYQHAVNDEGTHESCPI